LRSSKSSKLVHGVDWLRPDGRSGDHGITLEEYTPSEWWRGHASNAFDSHASGNIVTLLPP